MVNKRENINVMKYGDIYFYKVQSWSQVYSCLRKKKMGRKQTQEVQLKRTDLLMKKYF